MNKRYYCEGKIIGVVYWRDERWVVAWWSESGRVCSHMNIKGLPPCETSEMMQEKLDVWAAKRGLQEVSEP